MKDKAGKTKVLNIKWLVKPKIFIDGFHGSNVGALAEHHAGRITGQDIKQEKNDGDHTQQDQKSIP